MEEMGRNLQVAVVDAELVQDVEALDHLDEDLPDELLREELLLLLLLEYLLVKVPVVRVFHHDARARSVQHYSYHRQFDDGSRNASLYPMMFVCLIDARILTSFSALSFSFSLRF